MPALEKLGRHVSYDGFVRCVAAVLPFLLLVRHVTVDPELLKKGWFLCILVIFNQFGNLQVTYLLAHHMKRDRLLVLACYFLVLFIHCSHIY